MRPVRTLVALVITVILCGSPGLVHAGQGPDVRVLIDISGSMRRTDPHNLRKPSMELLAGLYPAGSLGGFWSFGQGVDVMVPFGRVDHHWREGAIAAAARIRSDSPFTDIPLALEAAAFDLDRRQPGQVSHIILLTDGFVDVGPSDEEDAAAVRYLVDDLLPRLRAGGFILHTVALSEEADHELMERLSVDSGGMALVAQRAEELSRIFLDALDRAAPAPQLPLEGERFQVDAGIRELTVLVLKEDDTPAVQLLAPDGARHDAAAHPGNMRWRRGEGYELITVDAPAPGTWRLGEAPIPGSRVTIVSDLQLQLSALPVTGFVTSGAQLEARLVDGGQPIQSPGFLGVVQMRGEVRREADAQQWTLDLHGGRRVPAGGRYQAALPMLARPGDYELLVTADGGTFQRQERRRVQVLAPFEVTLDTAGEVPALAVRMLHPDVDLETTDVLVRLRSPSGRGLGQRLEPVAERHWQAAIKGLDETGLYEFYVEVEGRLLDGQPLSFISDPMQLRVGAPPSETELPPEPEADPPEVPAEPVPESMPAPEETDTGLSWVFYALVVAGHLLIAGLGYAAWRVVRDDQPDELPVEVVVDEPGAEASSGTSTPAPAVEMPESGLDTDLAEEDSVASLLDALDDPLDLPDEAIDLDPARNMDVIGEEEGDETGRKTPDK